MFKKYEFKIAWRYLRARKKNSFISVTSIFSFLGILLGVAALIIVMSVMNGFRIELMDRILGINSHITVSSSEHFIKDYNDTLKNIDKIFGIKNRFPIVKGQALATANERHMGSIIKGMKRDDFLSKELVKDNIVAGRVWHADSEYEKKNTIVIGSQMAFELGVGIGDKISLILPRFTQTFFADIPRIKDFEVIGVFEVGMIEFDSSTIFMPIDIAKIFFESGGGISEIEVYVENQKNIDFVKSEIFQNLGLNFRTIDWKQANSNFVNALKTERNVMFIILTLIIAVAGFNIISGMVMLVNSKNKEISILRTIGITRLSMMRIFLICGFTIGILGTLFGLAIGVIFAENIEQIKSFVETLIGREVFPQEMYFLSKLPAKVEVSTVISVLSVSMLISILAPILPAWKASKQEPTEGLRYE